MTRKEQHQRRKSIAKAIRSGMDAPTAARHFDVSLKIVYLSMKDAGLTKVYVTNKKNFRTTDAAKAERSGQTNKTKTGQISRPWF